MKTQQLHFKRRLAITLLSMVFVSSLVFGQGNNWKLNLNNNANGNDGIGTSNSADLNFFTDNQKQMTLSPTGNLNLFNNMTIGGYLVVDSIRILTGAVIGDGTLNLDIPLADDISSTAGEFHFGRWPGLFSDVRVGIGLTNPTEKLHISDPGAIETEMIVENVNNIGATAFRFGVTDDGLARIVSPLTNVSPLRGEIYLQHLGFPGSDRIAVGIGITAGLTRPEGMLHIRNGGGPLQVPFKLILESVAVNTPPTHYDPDVSFNEAGNIKGQVKYHRDFPAVDAGLGFYVDENNSGYNHISTPDMFINGVTDNVGIGTNLTNPLERLHVDNLIRSDQLGATFAVSVNVGASEGLVIADNNGTMLSKLQFPNNNNVVLLGDGTFGMPALPPDADWSGAGSGHMSPTDLNDRVAIGINNAGSNKFRVYNTSERNAGLFWTDGAQVSFLPAGIVTSTTNGSGLNTGIFAFASSNLTNSQKLAVRAESYGTGIRNTAVGAFANGATSSQNIGIDAISTGASAQNVGVNAFAQGGTRDYALFAMVTPSAGGYPNDVAGYFSGDIAYTGNIIPVSDASLKQNIQDIGNASALLSGLQPRTFYYDTVSNPQMTLATGPQYGLIAQEVEQVIADIVTGAVFPAQFDSSGNQISPEVAYKGVNYTALIPFLIKGWQEQQNTIDSMLVVMGQCCNENTFKMGGGNNGGNEGEEIDEINEPIKEKLASKGIILYDAIPNPFQNEVSISFFIPERIIQAEIVFYDNYGRTLKTVEVNQRGNGTVIIDATDLANGLYSYGIVADGQLIDTKKMVRGK